MPQNENSDADATEIWSELRSLRGVDQTRQEMRSLQRQVQQMRWWMNLGLMLSLLSLGAVAALGAFIYYQWKPSQKLQSQNFSVFPIEQVLHS
ncbi:MAG: hypothetical protein WA828_19805 [Coleofasciculaceae cyanobacterium]